MIPTLTTVPQFADARGSLCSVEALSDVPFEVARVYWISSVPSGMERGGHAHRNVTEMLIAVAGSFRVSWAGAEHEGAATLSAPRDALIIPPLFWRDLDGFSADAVCVVLASGPYDPDEYVHDRAELRRLAAAQ